MDRLWRALSPARLFLALALPATLILSFAFPNFHAPDDSDHVMRAYTLAHGAAAPITPTGRSSGAMIDSGLADYVAAQRPVSVLSGAPPTAAEARASRYAPGLRSTGETRFAELPGAVAYFPALYAPQTLALEAARLGGLTISQSVLAARLANGLAGILLIALGLRLLPCGHALALVLLLLPRTLLQLASNSADPILYGLSLLVIALGLRQTGRLNGALAGAALFIGASVRPPLAALSLTPALRAVRNRDRGGLLLLAAGVAGAAAWTLLVLRQIVDLRCGGGGAPGPRMAEFALAWPRLIGTSLAEHGSYYLTSFIGHFGWGDGPNGRFSYALPSWMYISTLALLPIAVRNDVRAAAAPDRLERASLFAGAALLVLITFLAMFVACRASPTGSIAGVQGRYFLPALLALAPALSGLAPAAARDRLHSAFPILLSVWTAACTAGMALEAQRLYAA